MQLFVKRDVRTALSTGGLLSILEPKWGCFTLEPLTRSDGQKPRAIPAGTYRLTIRWSDKHGRMVPHVEDVSGFEAIEIHPGNYPHDTEGCLLVGRTRNTDFVGQSIGCFDELFKLLVANLTVPLCMDNQAAVYHCGTITYED